MKLNHCALFVGICLSTVNISVARTAFAEQINQDLEHIEIKGQLSTGLVQSSIALQDASSPDLRSQLSQLPGVSVNGNGMVSGIIQYRGLFGDRVKVNIDGVNIAGAGPNAMDSPLSHAIGAQHQVVLHQGIAPVSVGYETLGGAVEIEDQPPLLSTNNKWQTNGNLNAGAFSNNAAKSLNGAINGANKTYYYQLTGQFQEADNYEVVNAEIPSTFYQRGGGKLNVGRHTEHSKLDVTIGNTHTNASGTPALAMDIEYIDALWYKLAYQTDIADWTTSIKLFGNQNEHRMNNFMFRLAPMPQMHRENTVDSNAVGLDFSMTQASSNSSLALGGNYYRQTHNSRITNPNNAMFFINNFNNIEREVTSAFAQYQLLAAQGIQWQYGLRVSSVGSAAEEVGTNMVAMNPNAAAVVERFNLSQREQDRTLVDVVIKAQKRLSNDLGISLAVGQKQRAPSYNELYSWFPLGVSAGLADGRNYIGNLALNKESAHQFDLGVQYQSGNLTLLPNLFYHKISDYIIGAPTSDMPTNMIANMMGAQAPLQWSNQDAVLYGIDVYGAYTLSTNLQLTGSAKWVRGELDNSFVGETNSLYRIAPLTANAHLVYQSNSLTVDFAIEVAARQDRVSSLQNERETAGYAVFDLSLHYQVSDALRLSFLAENLTDKRYANHLGGINRITNTELNVGDAVPQIGRNLGIHAQYQF